MAAFYQNLERHGDRTALIAGTERLSYADLAARADAFAARHLPTDRRRLVFLEAANTVSAVVAYLGALRGSHVIHLFGTDEDAKIAGLIDTYAPDILIRQTGGDAVVSHPATRGHDLHPELRVLLSTSGSTGSPKLVKLSDRNIASNADAIAEYLELGPADRAVTTLKFNYSYGLSVLHAHLGAGGSLVLTDDSVVTPGFWDRFAEQGATGFAGVPYTFEMLARQPGWEATPGLRHATQAGGRLAPDLARQMAERSAAHGWRFYVMYGQTEAAPRMAYLPPDMAADHPDCIGRAIPGGTLSIVDAQGAPILADDVEGALRYAGPNVMMGYATGPADLATDEAAAHLDTGDVAVRTPAGLFRIVGRSARFVKPFGIRVNLDEVQARFPGSACAGDDRTIVLALPGNGVRPADAVAELVRVTHLPADMFRVMTVDEVPRLASGKTDYRTILTLGQSLVPEGRAAAPAGGGVRAIFQALSPRPVSDDGRFNDLASDSLSYVNTAIALEEHIGFLPENWTTLPARTLEAMRDDPAARTGFAEAERIHFFNAFRVFMLLLGIPYHAAMIYNADIAFRISAPQHSAIATWFTAAVHAFRMPGFFIISGYLAWTLVRDADVGAWLGRQLRKLGTPLVVALLTVMPLTLGVVARYNADQAGTGDALARWRALLATPSTFWLQHLWFLVAILTMYGLIAVLTLAGRRLPVLGRGWAVLERGIDRAPALSLVGLLALSAVYGFVSSAVRGKLGAAGVVLGVYDIGYTLLHAPAFLLGVMLAQVASLRRFATALHPLVIAMAAVSFALHMALGHATGRLGALYIANLVPCGILVSLALLGAWRRFANAPSRTVNRLLDASLVIYIWHMPFVIALGAWSVARGLAPAVAIPLVSALGFALSWGVYMIVRQSRLLSYAFNGGPLRPADKG